MIPALPEEYDTSMPLGAYYPSEMDKIRRQGAAGSDSARSHYPPHILAQQRTPTPRAQSYSTPQSSSSGLQQSQQAQQSNPSSSGQQQMSHPTPSDMLLIEEYQHPAMSVPGRTDSPSGQLPAQAYMGQANNPVAPHGPPVPATFASIMNAYPASNHE